MNHHISAALAHERVAEHLRRRPFVFPQVREVRRTARHTEGERW
jgi:hypothetical protein